MTDKELRALKRADLIEILYYLRRENDELTAENQRLRERLDALLGLTERLTPAQTAPEPQNTPAPKGKRRGKKHG
jgi:regulator of replication initiation timing